MLSLMWKKKWHLKVYHTHNLEVSTVALHIIDNFYSFLNFYYCRFILGEKDKESLQIARNHILMFSRQNFRELILALADEE